MASRVLRFQVTTDDASGRDLGQIGLEAFLGPEPGGTAPDFAFESFDGTKRSVSDFQGKYVLIDLWATWCGPCIARLPAMAEIHREFADSGRLVVLGLSLDNDREQARQFVRQRGLGWQQGFLGDWSETDVPLKYGISSIPAYLLIDPQGRLVQKGYQADTIMQVVRDNIASE